jgi:DNA-binding response OmpR family regulator
VVEDDPDMREVMEFMLQQLGCKIVLAESVEDARNVAAGEDLGLIVSDLGLPGESGLSLLTALGLKGKVPAVALSGYSSDEDVMASREAGFTEHLVKPVTPDKLLEVVRRVMGK